MLRANSSQQIPPQQQQQQQQIQLVVNGEQFLDELRGFFAAAGQKLGSVPHFNGRPLQLWQLYNAVVSRGGWQKVGQQNGWEDVSHCLGTPKPCANAGHALKAIYYQCLLKYECAKFNRAPVEDIYEDDDAFKRFALNGPGFSRIPDYLRACSGLSTDIKEEDAFERVQLSLASGLPNEVDFAINTVLVRSADTLRPFNLTPQRMSLMEALASTTGIFADHSGNLIGAYNNFIADTDKDFIRYWKETVDDEELWELLVVNGGACDQPMTSYTPSCDLFSDLPALDTNEMRITQIATIFLNLSLDDKNAELLAANTVCLKFSSLCANSRRNAVFELGLHLLTQLALKIDLPSHDAWLQSVLLKTVHRCIVSPDRLRHLLGLSLVGNMCEVDARQSCVGLALDEPHCMTLSQNLCVPDAPVVIFSLEVMYKLSGMGVEQATLISDSACNLDFLVRLLSVSSELIESAASEPSSTPEEPTPTAQPQHGSPHRTRNNVSSVQASPSISQQEMEELIPWFRSIYDEDESYAMSLSDVYKDYSAFCANGRKYQATFASFNQLYQLSFPKARSANYNLGGKHELCIAGIKRRNPLADIPNAPHPQDPRPAAVPAAPPQQPPPPFPPKLNGHHAAASHAGAPSPLIVPPAPVTDNRHHHEENGTTDEMTNSPAKRQKKTSDSSLIRSLLATKINRKQSSGSTDGSFHNHNTSTGTSNSSHSFDEWRTPVEPGIRSDLSASQMSDGIFSDLESNDSMLMTPPAQKGAPRSRSASVASDGAAKPKRKPPPKRKKKDDALLPPVLPNGNGAMTNGGSHLFDAADSSGSATTPNIVVPYVLPEPKPLKKVRGRKLNTEEGDAVAGEVLLNGQLVKAKKPKRPKKNAGQNGDANGLVNGHGGATVGGADGGAAVVEPSALVNEKPKRKPTKRKPKKKVEDGTMVARGVELLPVNGSMPSHVAPADGNILEYICDWEGCQRSFGQNAQAVFKHNYYEHVPTASHGVCRWPNCIGNGIQRQSLSLITHLHETHCSPNELHRQATRRQELQRNLAPTMPTMTPVAPPVSYSEHAALHAIQARYGSAVASDFHPEVESSNTRTLRLTAALVLRNISHFSHSGRIKLYKYEHILTLSAMMQSEASHVVSECLYYLAVHKREASQF
ncbi:AT-rich interactive domain-containing protein 2 [Hypsibius exemplaris]|uniref:AT-rich interactive domain-containing protein 2 n=1 Tax=Hypsibius exemplaris TaxID=2072580 RepID=A0A1W0X4X1_HYPEX|nr:AT-rich interactive domain-containing protein 2 [Hypsibius exemplaris]